MEKQSQENAEQDNPRKRFKFAECSAQYHLFNYRECLTAKRCNPMKKTAIKLALTKKLINENGGREALSELSTDDASAVEGQSDMRRMLDYWHKLQATKRRDSSDASSCKKSGAIKMRRKKSTSEKEKENVVPVDLEASEPNSTDVSEMDV